MRTFTCRSTFLYGGRYLKLTERGLVSVASSALKVGDIVVIEKGMRAPADVVLLRTTDTSGASFIR
jgi:phospholipid-translocating ATPase